MNTLPFSDLADAVREYQATGLSLTDYLSSLRLEEREAIRRREMAERIVALATSGKLKAETTGEHHATQAPNLANSQPEA